MRPMTRRQRVLNTLNFQPVDRLAKDLGAMRSTGISAFAYPALVAALGLPPRRPRIHDTSQMLALPDLDVLDALDCDVVTIDGGVTNAFAEPEKWQDYDFHGRLPAQVRTPTDFAVLPDGTLTQWNGTAIMPTTSFVFNTEHSGHALLDPGAPLPLLDLKKLRIELAQGALTDEQIRATTALCRRVREATDRAVFCADHFNSRLSIMAHGGLGIFPVICLLEPDYVQELHGLISEQVRRDVRALLPEIRDQVDIVLTGCDDWGTQNAPIASPELYRTLFQPYLRQLNDEVHRLAPGIKTYIHTCGAIYDLLDDMVDSGFDIINPVQWSAGGLGFRPWKDKLRRRATIWGGGVDSQHTLPLGDVAAVAREVAEVCRYFSVDSGFVFNNIHNLMAEVPADKVLAMYRTAAQIVPAG